MWGKKFRLFLLLSQALLSLPAAAAGTQGPRLIDTNRIDNTGAQVPRTKTTLTREDANLQALAGIKASFPLSRIDIAGSSLPRNDLAALSAHWRDKTVTGKDIAAIVGALQSLYRRHDYALFTIAVPKQDFAQGVLKLAVVEGHVGDVVIGGDTGHDLHLVQAYAARITAENPLRESTLERFLLLMGDIPGLSVNSSFRPSGKPGAVILVLILKHRRYELGSGYNNLGPGLLGRSEFEIDGAINNLFREGEKTQLIYGFPSDFRRFQLFGLTQDEAVGTNGAHLTFTTSYLETRPDDNTASGHAFSAGLQYNYPLLRSLRDNIYGTVGTDMLNSDNAVLGQLSTSERTRNLRAGLNASRTDPNGRAYTGLAVLSVGVNDFGAHGAEPVYGDPSFVKINARAGYSQPLPWGFTARLRAAGQAANGALPSSEQLTYGGQDFGGGFQTASFSGDDGLLGAAELAYSLKPVLGHTPFAESETYGFIDGGHLMNRNSTYLPAHMNGASAGGGLRLSLFGKAALQLQAAKPLAGEDEAFERQNGWLFGVQLRSLFQ